MYLNTILFALSSYFPGKITILVELNNGTLHQTWGSMRAAECNWRKKIIIIIPASTTLNQGPQISERPLGTDDTSQVSLFSHSHFLWMTISNLQISPFRCLIPTLILTHFQLMSLLLFSLKRQKKIRNDLPRLPKWALPSSGQPSLLLQWMGCPALLWY